MYNDIRLRNVIIDGDLVRLIDFGNAVEYLDCNGNHILNSKLTKLKGSVLLGSPNFLNFGKTSRKDDL